MTKQFRMNNQITATTVRVVYSDGTQTTVMPLTQAIAEAERLNVDLIEVSPTASPPVCKLMDYGKFLYQQQKAIKVNKSPEMKEIQLSPTIGTHDLTIKRNKIVEFLTDGHRVKVVVRFRGREIVHKENGMKLLAQLQTDVAHVGVAEQQPRMEGKLMLLTLKRKQGQ